VKIALKKTPVYKSSTVAVLAETKEDMYQSLLSIRGWMLSDTDWTQSNDCPLGEETIEAWRLWRQEFRDITKHVTVENVEDCFELSDPPEKGKPATWVNWEYENYFEVIKSFEDIHEQTQQLIVLQEQQNQQDNHTHTH
jgi:hypothetical protein